jgi:hypothetical protein
MEKTVVRQDSQSNLFAQVLRFVLPASLAVLLLAAAVLSFRAWQTTRQARDEARIAAMQAEAMAAIQDRWGIRIEQVAATADGGLVDLRYTITDPDKAIFIYDDIDNMPKLVTEDSHVEIAINNLSHEHDLEFGQMYFIIYRNVAGAVKPGGLVTVKVGDLSIEHFAVES